MDDAAGGQGFRIRSTKDVKITVPDKTETVGVDDSQSAIVSNPGVDQPKQEVSIEENRLSIQEHGPEETFEPDVMERKASIKTAINPGKGSTNPIQMEDRYGKKETIIKPKG
jgi:hypothetical protein